MSCRIAYEVWRETFGRRRSVVFQSKRKAQEFQRREDPSRLTVVKVCDGKVVKRGAKSYGPNAKVPAAPPRWF